MIATSDSSLSRLNGSANRVDYGDPKTPAVVAVRTAREIDRSTQKPEDDGRNQPADYPPSGFRSSWCAASNGQATISSSRRSPRIASSIWAGATPELARYGKLKRAATNCGPAAGLPICCCYARWQAGTRRHRGDKTSECSTSASGQKVPSGSWRHERAHRQPGRRYASGCRPHWFGSARSTRISQCLGIWDSKLAVRQKEIRKLEGHIEPATVGFSPDSKQILGLLDWQGTKARRVRLMGAVWSGQVRTAQLVCRPGFLGNPKPIKGTDLISKPSSCRVHARLRGTSGTRTTRCGSGTQRMAKVARKLDLGADHEKDLAINPDGRWFLTAHGDRTFRCCYLTRERKFSGRR